MERAMTRGNVLGCKKPKNRYILENKKSPELQQQIESTSKLILGNKLMFLHY